MIVISVAAAVITYIWITGYLGATMAGIGQQTNQMEISIDNASNSSSTQFIVVVHNIGDIAATVSQVYIGTTSQNLAAVTSFTASPTGSIAVQGTQTLTCIRTGSFVKGTTYVVKVVCTDAQSTMTTFTA